MTMYDFLLLFLSGLFSPSEMQAYKQLVTDIEDLISDEETFRLFTLVLLFFEVDSECFTPQLTSLRNSYINVLRRRLGKYWDTSLESNEFAVGNTIYSRFGQCIAGIKKLVSFVQKLLCFMRAEQLKAMKNGVETRREFIADDDTLNNADYNNDSPQNSVENK